MRFAKFLSVIERIYLGSIMLCFKGLDQDSLTQKQKYLKFLGHMSKVGSDI